MSVKLISARVPPLVGDLSRRGAGVVKSTMGKLWPRDADLDWRLRRLIEEVGWRARPSCRLSSKLRLKAAGVLILIACRELEAALAARLAVDLATDPEGSGFAMLLHLFELHLRMGSVRGQAAAAHERGADADAVKCRKLFDEGMADEKLARLSIRERTGKVKSAICASEGMIFTASRDANRRKLNRYLKATANR
jgi:hypothetical protein